MDFAQDPKDVIQALRTQRNSALDSVAQLSAIVASAQVQIERLVSRVKELEGGRAEIPKDAPKP